MTEEARLVPKRRFKEFEGTEEWAQRKLGDIVDVRSGRDYKHLSKGTIPVYGTGGYMLSVNEALSYDEDAIGIGRKGTIDKPYILRAPFWTVDTLFYVVPRRGNDLDFVFNIFRKIDWRKKDESSGVPSLSKTIITDLDILITKEKEQSIIGLFFAKLDNLITLHERKLEKTKALKSAYLSEMFPAEGEKNPRRRFAGFSGNWEQRTIGELCKEFQSGKFINASSISSVGDYPVYGGNGFRGYTKTYNHEGEFALIGRQGALCGNLQYFCGKAYFTEHAIAAQANNENDTQFLYYLFTMMNLGQYSGQSAQPGLAVRNLVKLNVLVPVKAEQSKIASLFKSLDNLITLHQRKLDKLQNLKKAYLNEMFI